MTESRNVHSLDLANAALILVDVQNDFCPGGSLAVNGGDEVIAPLNRMIDLFESRGRPIIATRDWHPRLTTHFQGNGGLWPQHCIFDQLGARFHNDLKIPPSTIIVSKGTGATEDAYSGFQALDANGHDLARLLADLRVRHVYVGGLATDYCVRATVLDARREGLDATVIENAIRGVELQPGDSARAMIEMREAGAQSITIV